jgi:hypothetical protein
MAEHERNIGAVAAGGLDALVRAVGQQKGPAPVHLWNPPDCGDIDMRIAADGTWYYQKTPIGRAALVKLFSTVLKREGERYMLVTPVEKCGIAVEDAPFLAVEMAVDAAGQDRTLVFRTNVDDLVRCDADHGLRFERDAPAGGLRPYVHVRAGLWAKVTRALYYDLVALGEARDVDGRAMFGIASGGAFFPMAPVADVAGLT